MPIDGIDHVQLAAPAGCEPEARRFFSGLLGLQEIPKPVRLAAKGGAWFRAGAQELHIGVEQDFTPARKAHPGLKVGRGELDGLAERLSGAGTNVIWDDAIEGVRRFYCEDPWGNRLELSER